MIFRREDFSHTNCQDITRIRDHLLTNEAFNFDVSETVITKKKNPVEVEAGTGEGRFESAKGGTDILDVGTTKPHDICSLYLLSLHFSHINVLALSATFLTLLFTPSTALQSATVLSIFALSDIYLD